MLSPRTLLLAAPLASALVGARDLTAGPQDPGAATVLARYDHLGKPAEVSRADVAIEMAFHQRRRDEGRDACEQLADAALNRKVARDLDVAPRAEEVATAWRELQKQFRSAGREPLRETGMTEAELLEMLSLDLCRERLVRRELDLKPDERVSPEMQKVWLQDQRKRHRVVTDPDQLPAGTAARVDGTDVPMVDLGQLLLRTADEAGRRKFVRQVVALRLLEDLGRQNDVSVSTQDLEVELAARRASAAQDPRYQGATFEALLKAQGITPADLLQSRVFRIQVLQKKIIAKLHPRAALLAELKADREKVLLRVGPRRQLSVIFARAIDEPNELVKRDFAAATAALQKAKARLAAGEDFDYVAKVESDDPASKQRGGDLGWHLPQSKALPAPVMAAAFALGQGDVSEPVRAEDGVYVVKVAAIEPMPSDDALVQRLRDQLAEQQTAELLRNAHIMTSDGKPYDQENGK